MCPFTGTVLAHGYQLFLYTAPSSWVLAPHTAPFLALPLPPTCPFILVLRPPAHSLFPGHWPLPNTISYIAHPPCAHPTLCSVLLQTLIENAEPQQAVPPWWRVVSSYSSFSLGSARQKRPLYPHTHLPGAASPAPRHLFPGASPFHFPSPPPPGYTPQAGLFQVRLPRGVAGKKRRREENERDRRSQFRASPPHPRLLGLASPSESPQLRSSPSTEQRGLARPV